jgi:hypothetical protein
MSSLLGFLFGYKASGDGVTVLEIVPAGALALGGPFVDVKTFGAPGTVGVGNAAADTAAFVAAFASLPGTGITLWVSTPTAPAYLITQKLVAQSNFRMWCSSNARIEGNIPGAATTDAIILANLPAVGATSTIAVQPSLGATVVALTSAAGVAIGGFLQLALAANPFINQIFRVVNVVGNNVTIDRPISRVYPAGTLSRFYATVPQNISLEFNGASMSGKCVVYITIVGGRDVIITGLHADPKSPLGSASDSGIAFLSGCYRSHVIDCVIDASSGSAGNKSLAFISCDTCLMQNVQAFNAITACIGITDSVYCSFVDVDSYGGFTGLLLASEGGAVGEASVISCGFSRIRCYGNSVSGIQLTDGSSYNTFDEVTASDGGQDGIVFINTALVMQGNRFSNVAAQNNARYGVNITTGVKRTSFVNVDVSNNAVIGFLASDEVSISNLSADSETTAGFVLDCASPTGIVSVRGAQLKGFVSPQYAIQVNAGTADIADLECELSNASIGVGVLAGVAKLTRCRITGGGGAIGVLAAGGTTRIGEGVDVDGCTTPVQVSPGAFINRATVQINGATPVPVPWPDFNSTDDVQMTMKTPTFAGLQTFAAVAYTPGTGFTVTGFAGDTSVYDYVVG